ncbi:MAG: hypothetical protein IAF02_20450, partial [Anaerolineae bacterium]|nr:hypothetical protein [Anaerolineae bacterium]
MDEQPELSQLRKTISQQFNLAEIRLLCADLGVDYENLSGDTRDEKALSLVEWAQRHGRLPALIDAINHRHPQMENGLR